VTTAHSDETKAAVLAEILAGASVRGVAKRHGLSPGTVRGWRAQAGLHPPPVSPQKRADLGEQLYGYLEDSLGALRAQLALFADPDWLKKQPAGDLAILHGIVADKTARLLAAIRVDERAGAAAIEPGADDGSGDGA
jgi:fructose-specific phosphotransferase system IIC component